VDCMHLSQERGSCEHGNEPLGSINGGEFFDQVGDC
jgi:hypothetical protein